MKKKKIVDSDISFYDILVKGISMVAAHIRDENILNVTKTANYECPSYISILKSHFRRDMERNMLLEPANRSFYSLFKNLT